MIAHEHVSDSGVSFLVMRHIRRLFESMVSEEFSAPQNLAALAHLLADPSNTQEWEVIDEVLDGFVGSCCCLYHAPKSNPRRKAWATLLQRIFLSVSVNFFPETNLTLEHMQLRRSFASNH